MVRVINGILSFSSQRCRGVSTLTRPIAILTFAEMEKWESTTRNGAPSEEDDKAAI